MLLCLTGAGILLFTAEVQAQANQPVNMALGKDAYMVRLQDNLPPASYGNDGNYATAVRTTDKTVDAYWEVDLGQAYALYSVMVMADDGFGDRMTHATVRLYDGDHESVFSIELDDFQPPVFTVHLPDPVTARYVRVGFENKERSSPTGGIEWYLGIKEVEAYGVPSSQVGLFRVTASANEIEPGQQITLSWQLNDVAELTLYSNPYTGSFKALTDSDGFGSFPFSPDTSQEYILVADRNPETYVKAVTVLVNDSPMTVRINEFMAQNSQTLKDGHGTTSDWIELYNPLNEPVDMTGYGLSDDPNDPMQWVFPDVNIPAHGCLLIFASGDSNSVDTQGFLHANWKLNAAGDSVVLTAPDGITIIDQILDYPAQREDLAYGCDLKNRNTLAFLEPTPGRINIAESYEGWLHPVVFSHARGFYDSPFHLSMVNLDPNALTLMSLDDYEPVTPVPPVFELPIQETVTVRANSVRQNYKPSDTVTHSYLFLDDIVTSPVMQKSIATDPRYADRIRQGLVDLPTLMVSVSELPDDYLERPASLEILWPGGVPESIQVGCGFARYGGAWTSFPKKNYKLKFRKAYGPGKLRAPLFEGFDHGITPADEFDTLELRGGSHDMNQRGFYMAASFMEDSMLDMGSLNPHGRFVHVYINGTYWGQYHLRERVDDNFLASYLKGGTDDYFNVKGNDNVGGGFVPGTPDPIHRHTWDTVRAMRGSFQAIKAYVDVPNLIDFMLVWFYGDCESEYRCAGPVAPGDSFDTGFKFWSADSDGFLRTSTMGSNKTSIAGPSDIFGSLVSERDPDFMTLLAERIGLHFTPGGALSPEQNTLRLEKRMAEIQDSLIAECARWNNRTPENWAAAAENIYSNLFPGRTDQLLGYMRQRGWYVTPNPPQFNQHGGQVPEGFRLVMNSSSGTIYYTLDGSDPRSREGSVSPDARVYVPSTSTEKLIPVGASWQYWDLGSEPVGDWKDPGYDDAAWSLGRAQLGYGDGGEATVMSFGPDSSRKYSAYYFRRTFTVSDPGNIEGLELKLVRDDGAVVYLNGQELLRSNMPAGPITYATTAVSGVGGADESNWFAYSTGPDTLVQGENVAAVEVHQISGTSSDISFDLELQARKTQVENTIILTHNTTVKARVLENGLWSAVNEASFVVGP
ncbi:MAG: lamin tail domain-containing protein [Phycisphaerae bacterium]|nr:lamin tail domain-containing protein [Phycisphaerae bacterium]